MKFTQEEKFFLLLALSEKSERNANALKKLENNKGRLSFRSLQELEEGLISARAAELGFMLMRKIIKSQKPIPESFEALREIDGNILTSRAIIAVLEACEEFDWTKAAGCN